MKLRQPRLQKGMKKLGTGGPNKFKAAPSIGGMAGVPKLPKMPKPATLAATPRRVPGTPGIPGMKKYGY